MGPGTGSAECSILARVLYPVTFNSGKQIRFASCSLASLIKRHHPVQVMLRLVYDRIEYGCCDADVIFHDYYTGPFGLCVSGLRNKYEVSSELKFKVI